MTRRRAIRTLLLALSVFVGFAIANVPRSCEKKRTSACGQLQRDIEGAKEQYAIEHDRIHPARLEELIPRYLTAEPVCPSGGAYLLGDMQHPVACSTEGHEVAW